ncbi:MAG: hypothetical protein ACN6NZ_00710, partial [Burkholderiales bacterium]
LTVVAGEVLLAQRATMQTLLDIAQRSEQAKRRLPAQFPPPRPVWKELRVLTLAAAMSLDLFAQNGLIAQLFSLMAPSTSVRLAGGIMALTTGCAMGGRFIMDRLLGRHTNRREAAAASYAVQALGTLILWAADPEHLAPFILDIVLFGLGIGNATSLPPLIAQAEFAPTDVPRVVARSVALSQALYAFAPAMLARNQKCTIDAQINHLSNDQINARQRDKNFDGNGEPKNRYQRIRVLGGLGTSCPDESYRLYHFQNLQPMATRSALIESSRGYPSLPSA